MNTSFALLARYGSNTIDLKYVCEEFFGIKINTAMQRAKIGSFPIPTFSLTDSKRCPTLVKVDDLAAYIDEKYEAARDEWNSVNS